MYGQKKMLTQIEREKIGVVCSYQTLHTVDSIQILARHQKKIGVVCSYQTLHTVDLIQILARHLLQVTKSLHAQKAISQHTTQQPKQRNFEGDSYKMALKIAPAEKFLLNVQPESCQATVCLTSIYNPHI
jgi:hypothetical protein